MIYSFIFFLRNAEAQKAFGHHTGVGRLPERPFFSIGRVDRKKMVRRFEKDFRRFFLKIKIPI